MRNHTQFALPQLHVCGVSRYVLAKQDNPSAIQVSMADSTTKEVRVFPFISEQSFVYMIVSVVHASADSRVRTIRDAIPATVRRPRKREPADVSSDREFKMPSMSSRRRTAVSDTQHADVVRGLCEMLLRASETVGHSKVKVEERLSE